MLTAQKRLRRLTVRALATRPGLLLTTALAEYDDATLAAQLGCPVAGVMRLRLCQPPRPAYWAADVQAIAARIGAEPAALSARLRRFAANSAGAATPPRPPGTS
ncbi:MAG TPA: hypothetical protein VK066_25950 [Chloroflexota bacterium]|nr:hypothetical protein [Chloroflexota bacterium]